MLANLHAENAPNEPLLISSSQRLGLRRMFLVYLVFRIREKTQNSNISPHGPSGALLDGGWKKLLTTSWSNAGSSGLTFLIALQFVAGVQLHQRCVSLPMAVEFDVGGWFDHLKFYYSHDIRLDCWNSIVIWEFHS